MNLIIDIGNTCVKLLSFKGNEVIEEKRSDKDDVEALKSFCTRYTFDKGIFSTVSELSDEYRKVLLELPFPILEFVSGETPTPINNKYKSPYTLGSDRLAAAVGAYSLTPGHNILIVDVGTCVTFDFINAQGEYLGGNISPGPTMRLKALNHYTSRLPIVDRRGETPDIGFNTETAIRSGVLNGIKYEIQGYVNKFIDKYPELYIYLTGGVHLNLLFSEKIHIFADDFIVPKGLNRILEYNNEFK